MEKAEQMPYAERRAYEMNNSGDDEDYTIEGKRMHTHPCRGSLTRNGRDQHEGKRDARPRLGDQRPL